MKQNPKDVHAIEIKLKPTKSSSSSSSNDNKAVSTKRSLPLHLPSIIEHEYAAKYLELMGAYPSNSNIDYLLSNMPISEGLIVPIWSRECIVVVPGMTIKEAESTNLMDKLLNTKAVTDDDNKKKNDPTTTNNNNNNVENHNADIKKVMDEIAVKEKITKDIMEGRRLSWCTVNTLGDMESAALIESLGKEEITSPLFLKMMQPLSFSEEQILSPISKFTVRLTEYLPRLLKETNDKMYRSMMRVLTSNATIKLYGLMCHFCYWNIVHPCIRKVILLLKEIDPDALNNGNYNTNDSYDDTSTQVSIGVLSLSSNTSLNERDKENIFVHLETCLSKLQKIMGYNVFALTTGYQGLISCCHFVVDDVLSTVYPWLHSTISTNKIDNKEKVNLLRLELKRLCHQSLTDLIDPSKVYTSSMLHSANIPTVKHVDNQGMGRFYCTSMATKAVFSDATDNEIRKLLSMNTNKSYAKIPGVNDNKNNINKESKQFLSPVKKINDNFYNESASTAEKIQRIQSESPILSPDKNLLQHLKNVRSLKERKIGIHLESSDIFANSFYDIKHIEGSSYSNYDKSRSFSMLKLSEEFEKVKKEKPKLDFKNLFTKKDSPTKNNENFNIAKEKYQSIVDEIMSAEVKSLRVHSNLENDSIGTMSTHETLLVSNPKTDFPISLTGKSTLINLLTERTSQHYNDKNKLAETRRNLITQKR